MLGSSIVGSSIRSEVGFRALTLALPMTALGRVLPMTSES